MTEVITIRKELAERLTRLPVETHESVTTLRNLRRVMERQRGLDRKANRVEVILIVGRLKWGCSEGTSYYVQCKDDLPEHLIDDECDVMTVAQHQRIVSALSQQYTESNQEARGNLSRRGLHLYLAEQILDNHPYEMQGSDFDYETPLHDKIKALLAERDTMRDALTKIAAIEDELVGGDWDEIEAARDIANAALGNVVSS